MGKKKKKAKYKKRKGGYSTKKQKKRLKKINKYNSRRDMMLDLFPKQCLDLMFDNEEDLKKFGDYLVNFQDSIDDDENYELLSGPNVYDEKIKKLEKKLGRNKTTIEDAFDITEKIYELKRKKEKNNKYASKLRSKDLSIASYLNDKKYKKKFLDKDKYRKHMKRIAKEEKKEFEEMKRLGYIKSNSPDKELNKLKLQKANDELSNALFDAYIQKHFVE